MPDEPWCDPPDWLEREESVLAPYAMRTRQSRGRRHAEAPHPYRTPYQRDRDRIVHATAFRRLLGKTQVLSQAGDHHRNRLTHTLEVAMISRTVARRLCLNEDLTEAIALSHDLGHPPFGHAGERALDECMRDHGALPESGGFEHNRHGLRVVEILEDRYPDFPGLNLSWEVLEAMAYHSKRPDAPEVKEFRQPGHPFLEAQVVDAADSLAYNAHDVDDALALGLIDLADLEEVEFWQGCLERARQRHRAIRPDQLRPTAIRTLLDWQVTDLLDQTLGRLRGHRIRSVAEVRGAPEPLVGHGPEVARLKRGLEAFLRARVYEHHRVLRLAAKGGRALAQLFAEFCRSPRLLSPRYAQRALAGDAHRTVCDYLAGMTDRFAQEEHQSLFQPLGGV
jgi:dGTPase